jgi:hypothetical protein
MIAALGVLQRVLPTEAAIWTNKGIHRVETIYADQWGSVYHYKATIDENSKS